MGKEVETRESLIQVAQDLMPEGYELDPGPAAGRYDGAGDKLLAAALDTIIGHGFEDEVYGTVEEGLYVARVGRFLYTEDDRGFRDAGDFPTVEDADKMARSLTGGEGRQDGC